MNVLHGFGPRSRIKPKEKIQISGGEVEQFLFHDKFWKFSFSSLSSFYSVVQAIAVLPLENGRDCQPRYTYTPKRKMVSGISVRIVFEMQNVKF